MSQIACPECSKKISRIQKSLSKLHDKFNSINHYLTHRANDAEKNKKERQKKLQHFQDAYKFIKRLKFSGMMCHNGDKNILFRCTNNEARKMRALIRIDFRSLGLWTKGGKLKYSITKKKS